MAKCSSTHTIPHHVIKKTFSHLAHQLSDHAQGLSDIYDRICSTIRQFQEDKIELQNRVQELEQHDPSTELQRLREENAGFRAKLAAAAKARSEITRERDALLRKLNAVKQLVDGASIPQVCFFCSPLPFMRDTLSYKILIVV